MDVLAVPLKKSSDIDLVKPLKTLIAAAFSSADNPADFHEAILELNKLRVTATKAVDKQESSVETLAKYIDQIAALESKIRPDVSSQLAFKWRDAFDKGSLFGGKASLTLSSFGYERVCCLFNMAALQSQIATTQKIDSDEGLKLAAKLLQQSSGIFAYLKGCIMSVLQQDPTPDMNPDTMSALAALMLAQAQEMFVLKAINDRMKENLIAKLAAQCDELYGDALKLMQKDFVKQGWDRDWIPKLSGKQCANQALAEFYQSRLCNSKKIIGEEIARLQHAVELFKLAQQRYGEPTYCQDHLNRAQRCLTDAIKDNDFIYHERIPDVRSLEPVPKATLAKPIPPGEHLSANFQDAFSNLTPLEIQKAVAAYEVRKAEIVNGEIGRLREATQFLNGVLSSLNLPAALEETSGVQVPQSVHEKAQGVKEAGGVACLEKMIEDLPALLTRNKEILDEAERLLNEEKESDDQLRNQFKERWTRTPSERLTETFRTNAAKYRQILTNAVQADQTVRSKFETHRKAFELLGGTDSDLEEALPSPSNTVVASGTPAASKLRQLMEQVDAIKTEREVIEGEFKSATTDMKAVFLHALGPDFNEPALSVETLGRIYGPLQAQVRDSLQRQEEILTKVQAANNEFVEQKSGSGSSTRDALLKQLAAGYDAYMELFSNLQEGTKFYNDLTQLLLSFQSKIVDFCFARKAEKEELLKDLSSNLANSAPAPPAAPQQYTPTTPTTTEGRTPPSRPPPPNLPQHAHPSQPGANPAHPPSYLPYPVQVQGMPQPFAANPYPSYMPPAYTPYGYGTYPGAGGAPAYNPMHAPGAYYPQQQGYYPGQAPQQQQQPQIPQQPGYNPYQPHQPPQQPW